MDTDRASAELDQLRAQLAAQHAEFVAFRAQVEAERRPRPRPRRPRRPRRALPLALVALLVALTPLVTLAASPVFSDLGQAAEVHRANIQAIGDAGITTGFEDPDHLGLRLYNPKGTVTREEMASFLARTAGLGTNPPVANAQTAVSAQTAASATTATNAGHASSADTAASAANAATVGGYGAPQLARLGLGTGLTTPTTITADINSWQDVATVTLTIPGPGYVLVSGAVIGVSAGSACGGNCTLIAQLHDLGGGPAAVSPYLGTLLGTDTTNSRTLSPTYVFPVAAGQRTFALEVHAGNGGQNNEKYFNPTVTALYVPFGASGNTP